MNEDPGVNDVPTRCWVDPRLQVRTSPIQGLGLFASAPIGRGELVGVLGGRVVSDKQLREVARGGNPYNSVAIDDGVNLILKDDDVLGRGNHSCDPNAWMRDAFRIEARRDIAQGEEVSQDYASYTALEWEMPCTCGSPLCRGLIRGSDWRRPELQDRYRNHFSPFLNERIRALRSQ